MVDFLSGFVLYKLYQIFLSFAIWSLHAPSLYSEQGQEDDADKVLQEMHHHGSDEALPPYIDETKDQAHAPTVITPADPS